MVTLFGILNIGSRGIAAAQAGLNTTGNNLSNVNTEGYSRQRLVQQSVDPLLFPNGAMGQGVDVITIERIRDLLLERQINTAKSDKNFNEELDSIFVRIQSILNDPLDPISDSLDNTSMGGLNNQLSRFFEAFHELSNSPEAPEVRAAAIESAQTLAQTFSVSSRQLQELRQDLNEKAKFYGNEINRILSEVAMLNQKITSTEGGSKVNANDYRDRRDLLVSQLSEIIPIKTIDNPNGSISISLAGQTIVDQVTVTPLKLEITDTEANMNKISFRVGEKGLNIIDAQVRQGKLGAILDARDRMIPILQQQVDELARGVIFEANKIHCAASGVEGYQAVTSRFDFPEGVDDPESRITLDKIFNNPMTADRRIMANQPYPIQDGSFTIRVADSKNNTLDTYSVEVQTGDTLSQIVDRIDRSDGIVSTARSALRFDPVYVEKTQGRFGAGENEIDLPIGSLLSVEGKPIAESPGAYSMQIYLRNRAGSTVDANPITPEMDAFTVNFNSGMTLQQVASEIQVAGGGKIRAQLVPSASDPATTVLRIEGIEKGSTISIQNDTSGLIEAFDFSITDPSLPLLGGSTAEALATFSGNSSDSLLGAGSPSFNTVYEGPPPTVIGEGSFELVVVNNLNQFAAKETITLSASGINTLDELASAIEAANNHLSVEITPDKKFIIRADNDYSFFFQNDTTGLMEAMGFSDINGYGKIGEQSFQDGSFEIVVANESGKVTNIVEVPVKADPSWNGGLFSLNDIVAQINRSSGEFGAPLFASIVPDPSDPSKNQLQIESETGYEFTFRSDDSLLLAALGFVNGPVLHGSGDNPLLGASGTVAVGDSIGGVVRARLLDDGQIEISTSSKEQLTFMGDDSHFLAASGINTLFWGSSALSMQVNKDIVENNNYLAASGNGTIGDNAAALAMAELQDEAVIKKMTLNEYYRSIVASLGNQASRARQLLQSNEDILRELETMREQDSGVSLDEESINLIRYQQAFQASARFISTIDNLIDVIINQIGA